MTAKHPASPCASCPYRKDAPLGYWHAQHFIDTLSSDASQFGSIFHCHLQDKKAPEDRGLCAGWLLDQVKRGAPNLNLRLAMFKRPDYVDAANVVHDGGLKLWKTVKAMCMANLKVIMRGTKRRARGTR